MLYSQADMKETSSQLMRRIAVAAAIAIIPNIIAGVIMYTVRLQWLTILLAFLGVGAAIFYWGLCCTPITSYLRFLREILDGRNHEFHATLNVIEQDSVREGVRCKTMLFADDAGDDQRLCYFDVQKYPEGGFELQQRYVVGVHGQSIIYMQPELAE